MVCQTKSDPAGQSLIIFRMKRKSLLVPITPEPAIEENPARDDGGNCGFFQ